MNLWNNSSHNTGYYSYSPAASHTERGGAPVSGGRWPQQGSARGGSSACTAPSSARPARASQHLEGEHFYLFNILNQV